MIHNFDTHRLSLVVSLLLLAVSALAGCSSSESVEPTSDPRPGIVFTTQDERGAMTIERIDPDGANRRVLIANGTMVVTPAYDGRMIALSHAFDTVAASIQIVSTGGRVISTRPPEVLTYVISLSPRADAIAYVRPDENALYVRELSSSTSRRLADGVAERTTPSFSPDGSLVAYVGADGEGARKLIVIGRDGSGRRVVADSAEAYGFPTLSWSPDGRSIAYIASRGPGHAALVTSIETGVTRALLPQVWTEQELQWSPDGTRIIVEVPSDIWIVEADGGNARRFAEAGDESLYRAPQWSPDGTKVLYIGEHGLTPFERNNELIVHDVASDVRTVIANRVVSAFWDHSK